MPIAASVPVRLNAPADKPISVSWATRNGTAAAGEDYIAASGVMSWGPGEQVKQIPLVVLDAAEPGIFYVDLTDPTTGATISIPTSTITLIRSTLPDDLTPLITSMMAAQWAYIQRATGEAATAAGMPPLVTAEGLVKNNQHPETVLGGYLPDGAASSEGISLMMRGVAQAYVATNDESYRAYFDFLFDAACDFFFFGQEPGPSGDWPHTWLVHAGTPFNTRGPIPESGALDQAGYIGVPITFTNGVAQISGTAPDVVFQVVTGDTEFVWNNVFSDIVAGTGSQVAVEYYIDAAGNKVFGTQKGGSFGQPIQPGSGEPPGRIKLKDTLSGTYRINYCVKVPDVFIGYGDTYEGWPMWRPLMPNEVSVAADAVHWFFDGFELMANKVPGEPRYGYGRARILDTWNETCAIEATNTTIFKGGASGAYNSFPLTYAYVYGREDVDDPATHWDAIPPSPRIPVARASDGFVTFSMPAMVGLPGSGDPVRYGFSFENEPLFLSYTAQTKVLLQVGSNLPSALVEVELVAPDESSFVALVPANSASLPGGQIDIPAFRRYQDTPGDSDGASSGDWSGGGDWEPPVYDAVPFPGRRAALIGDSITYQNTLYYPPFASGPNAGRFAYQGFGQGGWWNWAMMTLNHPLELEPDIQPNVNGTRSGYQVGIAGSKVVDWWLESFEPISGGGTQMGPMFAYRQFKDAVDVVTILGGTNDLSANRTAEQVVLSLRQAIYECAADGKWVFVITIPPRTTDLLQDYTLEQQDTVRARLAAVNDALRAEFGGTPRKANIWLVDPWDDLVGPNGVDPHGLQSDRTNPVGASTPGNWKPGKPQVFYFPDGLHPSVAGSRVIGAKLASVLTAAGIPARQGSNLGPLTAGPNLIENPGFLTSNTPWPQYSNTLGRAIGLGPAEAAQPGYRHGKVPDHWFLYRASNQDQESHSNFGDYTWSALVGAWPEVAPYMAEPTWPDGSVLTDIVTVDGAPAWRMRINIAGGNANEALIARTNVPARQNGPWNAHGWNTYPQTLPPVNDKYAPGDRVGAEMEVRLSNVQRLNTLRLAMNLLSVNDAAVSNGDNSTTGAVISGLGLSQTFWPPSDIDRHRYSPEDATLLLKTPIVRAPAPGAGQRTYAQINLEVSFDARSGPASATIIMRNPRMFKFGGPEL